MRNALLSLSLSAAALLGMAATGLANATDTDGALRSAVEARRDSLSEATDKVGKKQYKTTLKVLKLMDKTSKDAGGDAKAAGKIAKLLQKGFPVDFQVTADENFRDILQSLFQTIQSIVQDNLGELEDAVGALSSKGQAKVNAGLDKAGIALEDIDTSDLPLWAKLIVKAFKEYVKGQKVVDGDKGPTVGVSVQVNGKTVKPENSSSAPYVILQELSGQMNFQAVASKIGSFNVIFAAGPVQSTGSKNVISSTVLGIALPPKTYSGFSGTVNVTAIDLDANTITFTFSFTADGQLGTTGSVTVEGSYSGPYTQG